MAAVMARPTVVPLAIHAMSAFVPIRHVLPSLARLNMSPSLKAQPHSSLVRGRVDRFSQNQRY
jgi:hypothetical protein